MSEQGEKWRIVTNDEGGPGRPLLRTYLVSPSHEHIRFTKGLGAALPYLNALEAELEQLRPRAALAMDAGEYLTGFYNKLPGFRRIRMSGMAELVARYNALPPSQGEA